MCPAPAALPAAGDSAAAAEHTARSSLPGTPTAAGAGSGVTAGATAVAITGGATMLACTMLDTGMP